MKKKLLYTLTLLLFISLPFPIFAQEDVATVKESTVNCIDLESIYKEINDSSEAITGTKNSIDAVKKINTTASLMNILSVFVGDQIYCIKDEISASKSNSLKSQGLFGMLNSANNAMAMMVPEINAKENLAQMFIPGYKENNSLLAQGYPGVPGKKPSTEDQKDAEEKAGFLEDQFTDLMYGGIEDFADTVEFEEFEVEDADEDSFSGYYYLKDVIQLDKIWRQSLNIVYILYMVVFIIVGFMIMFRKKLQGNVTVTFSRALPNLIISLVLATFSFAIVGFMMDIGKTAINVSRNVFQNIYDDMNADANNSDKLKIIETKDVWSLANDAFKKTREDTWIDNLTDKIPAPFGDIVGGAIAGSGNSLGAEIGRAGVLGIIYLYLDKTMPQVIEMTEPEKAADVEVGAEFFGTINVEILQPILAAVMWVARNIVLVAKTGAQYIILGQLIKSLILIVICFYAAFKVFITLLTTYIKIFGNVLIAPFQLLVGAIPGNTGQITNWFKSVVANCLVFVAVFVVINASALIAVSINDPRKFNFFSNSGMLWPNILISLQSVIVIAGYLFASSMPKVINGALGIGANKSIMGAGDDMKQSMKKIPLVGGMFN